MENISSLNNVSKKLCKRNESEIKKKNFFVTCKWKGLVNEKLNNAAPFNFFLTSVRHFPETLEEDLSITFPELLDKSLGDLEYSLYLNFMVDFSWLLKQYEINAFNNPSITVLYGCGNAPHGVNDHINLTAIKVKSPYPFGHHHTKLSVFFYVDKSVRFSIYTANLIKSDWEDRVQGIQIINKRNGLVRYTKCFANSMQIISAFSIVLYNRGFLAQTLTNVWVSPKCSYLGDKVPINYGESETFFKHDILNYLNSYHLQELQEYIFKIQKCDCSSIKVCFIASTPGMHKHSFGLLKLSKLIKDHSLQQDSFSWHLVAQCSSIGSLGSSPDSWLFPEFGKSLLENSNFPFHTISVIYPSVENVKQSIYGMWGGACLPYSSTVHKRQTWLKKYLFQWKYDSRNRSKVIPHIKSYSKISQDGKQLAWFLVTSANLSKAAWGKFNAAGLLRILSYEAGVVFFPKFLIGSNVFNVKQERGGHLVFNKEEFPLPFDLPLTSYKLNDQIFLYDKHFPH